MAAAGERGCCGVRGQLVVSAGRGWDERLLVAPGHGDGNFDRRAALEAASPGVREAGA